MMRLVPCDSRPTIRSHADTHMLVEFADQLFTESACCQDIRFGPWLFLARIGEGLRNYDRQFEHRLWTAIAGIGPDEMPRQNWLPDHLTFGVIAPEPNSVQIHKTASGALERVASTSGLAGIAICVDRKSDRNDDLLWALASLLEPRHPDDTGPMVWYGRPPRPPGARASLGGRP